MSSYGQINYGQDYTGTLTLEIATLLNEIPLPTAVAVSGPTPEGSESTPPTDNPDGSVTVACRDGSVALTKRQYTALKQHWSYTDVSAAMHKHSGSELKSGANSLLGEGGGEEGPNGEGTSGETVGGCRGACGSCTVGCPLATYQDMIGYFHIPMATPLTEGGEPTAVDHEAPKNKTKGLKAHGYTEMNYIPLIIPRYICLQFLDIIPAGTKFIVAFIGGSTNISNIHIIGVAM